MVRLKVEFALLYVVLPVALLAVRLRVSSFPVLPALWLAAYPAARWLVLRRGWGVRELTGLSLTRAQAARLLVRVAAAAALLAGGILWLAPEQFLELPRRSPRLWALVLLFYPLLSVYPQGILYRGLFFARYGGLFRSERTARLACAAAFGLAHALFANVWAVALTFAGGVFLARTYRQTGSLLASALEHAAYGQLAFTLGWGRFLYHGTTRLVERGLAAG